MDQKNCKNCSNANGNMQNCAMYRCTNCGTMHQSVNGEKPKACVKCDGTEFRSCGK